MKAVRAYEGVGGRLHHDESYAIAEIIIGCGEGTLAAIMRTRDAGYMPDVQDAILRAAEIIQKLRKKSS